MSDQRLQRSLRATFLGMVVNTVLAVGKMAAGFLGHSHALVADGRASEQACWHQIVLAQRRNGRTVRVGQVPCMGRRVNSARAGRQQR